MNSADIGQPAWASKAHVFCGGEWQELSQGQKWEFSRDWLSNGVDMVLSNRFPPRVYDVGGQWVVHNQYRNKSLVVVYDDDLINRVPRHGGTQALQDGDYVVHVARDYPVGVLIEGSPAIEITRPIITLESEDPQTIEDVKGLLTSRQRYREVVLARFQNFLNPLVSDPRVLTAEDVRACAPDMSAAFVNQVQRDLHKITQLHAGFELGNWLTYHGVLRLRDRIDIPHSAACDHAAGSAGSRYADYPA